MIKLTKAQRKAVFRVFQREYPERITPFKVDSPETCPTCGAPDILRGAGWRRASSVPYRRFRKLVTYYDGACVMLPWKGMYLGIEPDGYVHS